MSPFFYFFRIVEIVKLENFYIYLLLDLDMVYDVPWDWPTRVPNLNHWIWQSTNHHLEVHGRQRQGLSLIWIRIWNMYKKYIFFFTLIPKYSPLHICKAKIYSYCVMFLIRSIGSYSGSIFICLGSLLHCEHTSESAKQIQFLHLQRLLDDQTRTSRSWEHHVEANISKDKI